jgi:Methyltransferase domain
VRSRVALALALARHARRHPIEAAYFALANTEMLRDRLSRERRPAPLPVTPDWQRALDNLLGVDSQPADGSEFEEAWQALCGRLAQSGFGYDADPALARAAFRIVRALRPDVVVETGVARGITSAAVLDAMDANGKGHLWSIDLPPLHPPALRMQLGAAVSEHVRGRWTYLRGPSRRLLPRLVAQVACVDLFIHDSVHSKATVVWELERVWDAMGNPGIALVDDVDVHGGMAEFVRRHSPPAWLVAPQSTGGAFGVITKRLARPAYHS